MHHADIIASLHKSNKSPAQVARDLGLHRSTISMVIRGNGKSRRVANHIAKVTGKPVSILWPGRYPQASRRTTA